MREGSTTVWPICAWAMSQAATTEGASAMRTIRPCSTASAATSLAICLDVPMTRVRPLASNTTTRSPCDSTRGEQARAISAKAPGLETVFSD